MGHRRQTRLADVAREWSRLGATGFGGPPTHIRMLRDLCVRDRGWMDGEEFEHAVAACNVLPGPASTQLAIYCAWRVAGPIGAVVGGLMFIVPGLLVIIALATLFLADRTPVLLKGVAQGAGAAVAAVAVHASWTLARPSWDRRGSSARWSTYAAVGVVCSVAAGPYVVVALVACGLAEWSASRRTRTTSAIPALGSRHVLITWLTGGPLAWSALKVGALSYGGGFVIVPLLRADAVVSHHWMSSAQFLTAVALGQVTPGPVLLTVAVVGYAAAGVIGALLAAVVAFAPSFAFVLVGAPRFDRWRGRPGPQAFLSGAGPAAIGAIAGSAVPLAASVATAWQAAVLVVAAWLLLRMRTGVVATLGLAACVGVVVTVLT